MSACFVVIAGSMLMVFFLWMVFREPRVDCPVCNVPTTKDYRPIGYDYYEPLPPQLFLHW